MLAVTLVIMIIMMTMVLLMDDLTILSVHLTIIGRLPSARLCRDRCVLIGLLSSDYAGDF